MKRLWRILKYVGITLGLIVIGLAIWIGPMIWPKPQVYGKIPPQLPADIEAACISGVFEDQRVSQR